MQTKEAIQFALTASHQAVFGMIDKMSDAALTFPTPSGGCHPLWVLGHLTIVEGMIPAVIFGGPNPVSDWQQCFGEGTQPVADAAAYPPFAEIKEKYLELRARNLKFLNSLKPEELDEPVKAPPAGREYLFATVGHTFLALAMHQMMHYGHVTDAMRAAGRKTQNAQAA